MTVRAGGRRCRVSEISRKRCARRARGIAVWQLVLVAALIVAAFLTIRREWERVRMRDAQQEGAGALRDLAAKMNAYKDAHGAYTTDLVAIGFAPRRGARYVVGFTVPHYPAGLEPAEDFRSFTGYVQVRRSDPRGPWDHERQVRGDGRYLNPFDLVVERGVQRLVPQATDGCFLAGAAADLDDDPTLDAWTVDCHGRVAHAVDDWTDRVAEWPRVEGLSDSVESARERERLAHAAAVVAAAPAAR